jgi:AP-3 complex subunit delta-1
MSSPLIVRTDRGHAYILKQDLSASAPSEVATALNGLSHIVTPDLARDLALDLNAMLNHSRPQIRKRSVLVLYKVFLKYPEALEHSIVRLREKLEDPDPGIL